MAVVSSGGTAFWSLRLEIFAWLAIATVALGIRALNLDGAPLQPGESALALDSLAIVQRTGLDLAGNPLLVYANAFVFLVFGATDATARFLPMIAGFFLTLSPLAFRSRLSPVGAAAAGLTLALSSTLVFASRSVDSTSLSLALALGVVVAWRAYRRSQRLGYLYLAALLAVGVIVSGPLAVPLALILVAYAIDRLNRRQGLALLANLEPAKGETTPAKPDQAGPLAVDRELALRLAGFAAITYAIVATGFGTNLSGLGDAIAGPVGSWLTAVSQNGTTAVVLLPTLLLAYEPLVLAGGIAGTALALRAARPFESFLVWWAVAGLVLFALSGGANPIWVSLVLVPLAFLTGSAVAALIRAIEATGLLRLHFERSSDGLDGSFRAFEGAEPLRPFAVFAILGLSFCYTFFIALGNVTLPDPNVPTSVLLAPVLALAILATTFASRYGWRLTGLAAAAPGLVLLLILSLHATTQLNPGGALDPAEAYVGTATSPDVRTLSQDTSIILNELHIARQIEGLPVTETVEVARPFDLPVAWYLRQWPQTEVVASVDDSPGIAIEGADAKAPRGPYAGETFQVSSTVERPGLNPTEIVRWWLYREAPNRTDAYVKVFVKTQLAQH